MGSHAACVWALVSVTCPLVVVRGRDRYHVGAVADDHVRHLDSFEALLDEHSVTALAEPAAHEKGIDSGVQLVVGADDQHPLAGCQAVGLEDHRESAISCCLEGFVPVTYDHGFGGRNTVSLAELLGEHLARLELRRQPVRAEQAEPSAGELVSDAERERQFGTDHREVDAQIRGCFRDTWKVVRSHREEIRGLSDSGVARSRVELCDARRPPQCVHDGVLSTAGAEHQHPHRA